MTISRHANSNLVLDLTWEMPTYIVILCRINEPETKQVNCQGYPMPMDEATMMIVASDVKVDQAL